MPSTQHITDQLHELTAFARPSASKGERKAARLIAREWKSAGAKTWIEEHKVLGNYWLPLGLCNLLAAVCAFTVLKKNLLPVRVSAALLALASSFLIADDISANKRWLRKLFPKRRTYNVLGEMGDPDADRTVVFVSHHDAAKAGLIFHPSIPRQAARVMGERMEDNTEGPPVMLPVVAAPLLASAAALLGKRKMLWGAAAFALFICSIFVDIGGRKVVPGANDNASGVVCLNQLARLAQRSKLRVLLLSTGSEESLLEGMSAFAKKWFPTLPPEKTFFVVVDTVGSSQLCVLSGEGMLRMKDYPAGCVKLAEKAAHNRGVSLLSGLRHRNSTDGLYPLQSGYPTVMLGSVNEYRVPANYHWHTDTVDQLHISTVEEAITLCDELLVQLQQIDDWGDLL